MEKYLFPAPLVEGLIKSRPNRFIMMVQINGNVEKCHCPSTGQIASITFNDIPCLLSESKDSSRKTKFTVEAISLDQKEVKKKDWIGINQVKANEYVEFLIKAKKLSRMLPKVEEVRREVRLNRSRIDFLINNRDFLEVKTLLKDIPSMNHPNYKRRESKFVSFDRIIKHFNDISSDINGNSRAIFLLCYLYDAKPFVVPEEEPSQNITNAARRAVSRGLENWQINLRVDRYGVELIDYFKLKLFS
jgi:sugar fermentation stimulation protein A